MDLSSISVEILGSARVMGCPSPGPVNPQPVSRVQMLAGLIGLLQGRVQHFIEVDHQNPRSQPLAVLFLLSHLPETCTCLSKLARAQVWTLGIGHLKQASSSAWASQDTAGCKTATSAWDWRTFSVTFSVTLPVLPVQPSPHEFLDSKCHFLPVSQIGV